MNLKHPVTLERRMARAAIPIVALLLFSLVTMTSCAKRIDPVTGIATNATPYEQALAINASIAITVQEFNSGIIAANRMGYTSDTVTEEVTSKTFLIAVRNKQLSEILKLGPEKAKLRSGEIIQLAALMEESIRALLFRKDITAGNETKTLALTSAINSVYSLTLNFRTRLTAAGVI